jgi:hypothetical protein
MANECVIVVPSCDGYSDLWQGLKNSFDKFWPDCPFELYLVSNETAGLEGFRNIRVGRDLGWSANLKKALQSIEAEYVLLWIDDLYIVEALNNRRIVSLVEHAMCGKYDYLRLNPVPPPPNAELVAANVSVGRLPEGDLYRASTICSLWRREVLSDLLDPVESAWEFEHSGSERSGKYAKFYASSIKNLRVANTIVKGVWDPAALILVKELGLVAGPGTRPVMKKPQAWMNRLKRLRSSCFSLLPRQWRYGVRKCLRH